MRAEKDGVVVIAAIVVGAIMTTRIIISTISDIITTDIMTPDIMTTADIMTIVSMTAATVGHDVPPPSGRGSKTCDHRKTKLNAPLGKTKDDPTKTKQDLSKTKQNLSKSDMIIIIIIIIIKAQGVQVTFRATLRLLRALSSFRLPQWRKLKSLLSLRN